MANAGATNIRSVVKPEYLGAALKVYNHAVVSVFDVAVGTSCVLIVGALIMECKSVKKDKEAFKEHEKAQKREVSKGLT